MESRRGIQYNVQPLTETAEIIRWIPNATLNSSELSGFRSGVYFAIPKQQETFNQQSLLIDRNRHNTPPYEHLDSNFLILSGLKLSPERERHDSG